MIVGRSEDRKSGSPEVRKSGGEKRLLLEINVLCARVTLSVIYGMNLMSLYPTIYFY